MLKKKRRGGELAFLLSIMISTTEGLRLTTGVRVGVSSTGPLPVIGSPSMKNMDEWGRVKMKSLKHRRFRGGGRGAGFLNSLAWQLFRPPDPHLVFDLPVGRVGGDQVIWPDLDCVDKLKYTMCVEGLVFSCELLPFWCWAPF